MSDMHHAVRRVVAATEARHAAHAEAVASELSGRSEEQPPAGRHPPAGPMFPLQLSEGGTSGPDPHDG